MKIKSLVSTAAVIGLVAPGFAFATNGYFSEGYGMKNKGRAGAATAMTDSAFGGATNPATMVFTGDRIDFGITLFSPRREASRTGSGAAGVDGSADSDSNYFGIPEFGYNKMINQNLSLGITVYGNGGMNTDYPGGQISAASACAAFNPGQPSYNLLCGNGALGVDLMQLIIAPTLAYKINPNHSIGIAPLIGYQRFAAEGLQGFAGFSTDPANLTNRGHDDSFGYGVRVGWYGKVSPTLALGAAYASKMSMDEFDKYRGLFAQQGGFDIPEHYNVGVAWQATPKLLVALDYQRINYSKIDSVGNPSADILQCAGGNLASCLGGSAGAGFGWQDINVFKLGFEYQYNQEWTLRAGWNHGDNPIRSQDVTFNILAPGVMEDHITLGATYKTRGGGELTMFYMHAFSSDVTGPSLFTSFGAPATTTETIKMYQNSIGIAYGWKM